MLLNALPSQAVWMRKRSRNLTENCSIKRYVLYPPVTIKRQIIKRHVEILERPDGHCFTGRRAR